MAQYTPAWGAVADRAPSQRLQPCLLDRLTDDEPDQPHEPAEARAMTLSRLRDSVRRDLTWLLNAVGLEAVQDLSAHEEVQRSTLNFGIPDVTGRAVSTIDRAALASKIRRAICDFEPRLLRHSVSVRPTTSQGSGPSTLCFSIEAELWAQPTPLHLLFQTELNLESGDARVTDDRTE